jgi:UDP-N-acetylglucosamine/UDP-N-acetylgalactosamine 4-epimerase
MWREKLVEMMNGILGKSIEPQYEPSRKGDVRHSLADVSKAQKMLGYAPLVSLEKGLQQVMDWYRNAQGGTDDSRLVD